MEENSAKNPEKEFLPYKVVYRFGTGEYVEKKSRFIASVAPAASEEEAVDFIDSVRKKYYDARHNCPAFIIGRNREVTRCSDDGEPSGTAGKPVLEVMLGEALTNTVIVVTRYFGGTLLGTGGLVRAYTQAAKAGILDAGIAVMRYGVQVNLTTDYTDAGKIQYFLEKEHIEIRKSRYTDKVEFDILIPILQTEEIKKKLIQLTSARVGIETTGSGYYMDKT